VAYEIEPNAIKISQKNYPMIEHCGDVTVADFTQYEGIDLLIGGSPCQGFSIAGKQLNFEDPRSKLYFEFERALKEAKPKYFLLENVKMKKEYADVITERLGVQPIEINSNLLSAQNRKRIYWTNIPGVTAPADIGVMLADIVHENEKNQKYDLEPYKVPFSKALKILDKEVYTGKIGYFRQDSQANRVYSVHGKAVTLCGEAGVGAAKMGQYLFGCLTPDRENKRQVGQRFNNGEKFYTLTAQDRHGVLIDGYIRKLTPIECERLQNLPDRYTEGIAEPQRYKCLGNGFTVDVIAHIFKGLRTT
jgi:DNA (cytosine-5)-methyltransferase 3A